MPKKVLKGTVSSGKMNKTVVVQVTTTKRHPIYKKLIMTSKKFKARDDLGVQEGDIVSIEECKPLSKSVTWKVVSKEEAK